MRKPTDIVLQCPTHVAVSAHSQAMDFTKPTLPAGADKAADGDEGGDEGGDDARVRPDPGDGKQWWEARARDTDDKLFAEIARMHFRVLKLWGSWKRREEWGIVLQQVRY